MENKLKTKGILRFYFAADCLERALSNAILRKACDRAGGALDAAERICEAVGDKICLERLWAYLDGVLSTMTEEEMGALASYAAGADFERRAVCRAAIKFTRRARRLNCFAREMRLLEKYYCLLRLEVPLSARDVKHD